MCPKNETCDRINYHVIQQLPGEGSGAMLWERVGAPLP